MGNYIPLCVYIANYWHERNGPDFAQILYGNSFLLLEELQKFIKGEKNMRGFLGLRRGIVDVIPKRRKFEDIIL